MARLLAFRLLLPTITTVGIVAYPVCETKRRHFHLVEIDDLLAEAARRVGRNLDAAEIDRFKVPMPLRFKYQPSG